MNEWDDGPESFERVDRGGATALVRRKFMPYLADALFEQRGCEPAGLSGRGHLLRCQTPHGAVLIRPYRRGGWAAKLLGDRYIMRNPAHEELIFHDMAWKAGVPTVQPVGAVWRRSGVVFRAAYATLEADGVDLLHYLSHTAPPEPAVLASCGRAIRAMHRAGIGHADLQVKNLLVSSGRALIIDFDRAGPLKGAAPRNLARLRRSFAKRKLNLAAFEAIVDAYSRDQ